VISSLKKTGRKEVLELIENTLIETRGEYDVYGEEVNFNPEDIREINPNEDN